MLVKVHIKCHVDLLLRSESWGMAGTAIRSFSLAEPSVMNVRNCCNIIVFVVDYCLINYFNLNFNFAFVVSFCNILSKPVDNIVITFAQRQTILHAPRKTLTFAS